MRPSSATKFTRPARRGVTMIEVLIVATGVTMLLAVCAVSIQLLMRLNADVQARYRATVALERLARQVRDDAHASATVRIAVDHKAAGKPTRLHLAFEPDRSVDYERGDGGVVRTESRAGKVVRHETYALPRGSVPGFELREEAARKLVVLVINRAAVESKVEPPRPLEIVALQGKDHLELPAKQGEQPR